MFVNFSYKCIENVTPTKSETHIYHVRYQESKHKDKYLLQHEIELLDNDSAKNVLKRFGIDIRNLNIKKPPQ